MSIVCPSTRTPRSTLSMATLTREFTRDPVRMFAGFDSKSSSRTSAKLISDEMRAPRAEINHHLLPFTLIRNPPTRQ